MTDEIVFYTHPQSRGAMTHWMLEEIGCPYHVEVKAFGPDMKTPDYLAINPMGKVPAIVHGGRVVTETGAILCYLADAFPQAGLAPRRVLPLKGPRSCIRFTRSLPRSGMVDLRNDDGNPPPGARNGLGSRQGCGRYCTRAGSRRPSAP